MCNKYVFSLLVAAGTILQPIYPFWGEESKTDQLREAARDGAAFKVSSLLDQGADPFKTDSEGNNALHTAIYYTNSPGHVDTVEYILERAEALKRLPEILEKRNGAGSTPLLMALEGGFTEYHRQIADWLLYKGAKVNVGTPSQKHSSGKGGESALHFAAQAGALEAVKIMLERGAAVDYRNDEDQTPLHYAAEIGQTSVVPLLFKAGADPNARDEDGETALYKAADGLKMLMVALLLQYDEVDVDLQDNRGMSPLEQALSSMQEYSPGMTAKIAQGARKRGLPRIIVDNILMSEEESDILQHFSSSYGGLLYMLVEGVEKRNESDELMVDSETNVPLRTNRADLTKVARNGNTHLQNFVALGMDGIAVRDDKAPDRKSFVELFVKNGSDVTKKFANTIENVRAGYAGLTLLQVAVGNATPNVVMHLLFETDGDGVILRGEDNQPVLRQGIDVHQKYPDTLRGMWAGTAKLTPLQVAVKTGVPALVNHLLAAGAEVDTRYPGTQETPLIACLSSYKHLKDSYLKKAVQYYRTYSMGTKHHLPEQVMQGYQTIFENLIRHGANLDAQDAQGRSALHLLADLGFKELIEKHFSTADINIADASGDTPLHYLLRSKDVQAIERRELFEVFTQRRSLEIDKTNKKGESALFDAARGADVQLVNNILAEGADPMLKNAKGKTPVDVASSGLIHGWLLAKKNEEKDVQTVQRLQEKFEDSPLNSWTRISSSDVANVRWSIENQKRNASRARARIEEYETERATLQALSPEEIQEYNKEHGSNLHENRVSQLGRFIQRAESDIRNNEARAAQSIRDLKRFLSPIQSVGDQLRELTDLAVLLEEDFEQSSRFIWRQDGRRAMKDLKESVQEFRNKIRHNLRQAASVPEGIDTELARTIEQARSSIDEQFERVIEQVQGKILSKKYASEEEKVENYKVGFKLLTFYRDQLYDKLDYFPENLRGAFGAAKSPLVLTLKKTGYESDSDEIGGVQYEEVTTSEWLKDFFFHTTKGKVVLASMAVAAGAVAAVWMYKKGYFTWLKRKIKYDFFKRYEPLSEKERIEVTRRLKRLKSIFPGDRYEKEKAYLLYVYKPQDREKIIQAVEGTKAKPKPGAGKPSAQGG